MPNYYPNFSPESSIDYSDIYKESEYHKNSNSLSYDMPESFNQPFRVWSFIGHIVNVFEKEITVSLIEPETNKTVYKKILKKDINFDCSENDYIKITINEYWNMQTDYKIEKCDFIINKTERQKVIQDIKSRADCNDII